MPNLQRLKLSYGTFVEYRWLNLNWSPLDRFRWDSLLKTDIRFDRLEFVEMTGITDMKSLLHLCPNVETLSIRPFYGETENLYEELRDFFDYILPKERFPILKNLKEMIRTTNPRTSLFQHDGEPRVLENLAVLQLHHRFDSQQWTMDGFYEKIEMKIRAGCERIWTLCDGEVPRMLSGKRKIVVELYLEIEDSSWTFDGEQCSMESKTYHSSEC